jgi:hypothetical protein
VDVNVGPDSTSYSDFSVAPDSTYHYRVAALNAVGQSAFSDPDSATTPTVPPSFPVFHSDFTEASLGDITGLFKDVPGAPTEDFDLNTTNNTLDFVTTDADMWTQRANAPLGWVAAPTVGTGETWSVETHVSMEKDGANSQEVAGITFYGGPDGAHPDLSFGLDDWNGWLVQLQGLGDNDPLAPGSDLGSATGVFLRAEITEGGATDTYNFYYKVNSGDAWTRLEGEAINFASDFPNSRVALFLKSDSTGGGAAQFDYLTIEAPGVPLVLDIGLSATDAVISWTGDVSRTYTLQEGVGQGGPWGWTNSPPYVDMPGSNGTMSVTTPLDDARKAWRVVEE